MALFYQCIMCQQQNHSIVDLHNHHIRYHNPEELSQTIIHLQGFKVWSNMNFVQEENVGYNNNNESMCNNFFAKPKLQARLQDVETVPEKIVIHDNTTCALHCSQFMAWEHELNKREEINDEDFLDSIESLCYDLTRKKPHRGRKKKETTGQEKKDVSRLQYIENVIGARSTIVLEKSHTEPCQIATTSYYNTNDFIMTNSTINNNITSIDRSSKIEGVENKKPTTLALSDSNINTNVTMNDSLSNNFSWHSIITLTNDK